MKEKDLIKGKYYLTSYPDQGDYIFLCKQDGSGLDSTWIRTNDSYNTFKSNGGNLTQNNGFKKYRLATPEECEHLEQCIQADKYVDYKKEELPKEWAIKVTEKNRAIISKARLLYGTYKNVLSGSIKDLWIINNKNSSIIGSSTSNGYTEITDDQFKRLVLKENNMKKKIIGYKCPTDLFKGRIRKGEIFTERSTKDFVMYHKDHMTSGVPLEIVESWEPVYEEEFKAGDYVLANGDAGAGGWSEQIVKLYSMKDNPGNYLGGKMKETANFKALLKSGYCYNIVQSNIIRKATPEEIRKAQEIKIDKYTVDYPGNGIAKIGCNEYTIDQIESLLSLMNSPNSSVNAIRVEGGIIVTKEQIQEIFDKFN